MRRVHNRVFTLAWLDGTDLDSEKRRDGHNIIYALSKLSRDEYVF